jgi:uncharacterized membrane protein YeiB
MFPVNLSVDLPWSSSFAQRWADPLDQLLLNTVHFLANGKFIALFSLLFGVGFALQLERARNGDASFAWSYLRRLLGLLAIGLLGMSINLIPSLQASIPAWENPDSFELPVAVELIRRKSFWPIGGPALGIAYASLLCILYPNPAWKMRLAPLGPVGRLALSNYLLQGVVFVTLSYAIGLGLYGELGPKPTLPLVLVLLPILVVASAWWVRRFRFGPVEWAWRAPTYGSLQKLRLSASGKDGAGQSNVDHRAVDSRDGDAGAPHGLP